MNIKNGVSTREALEILTPLHLAALHNFLAEHSNRARDKEAIKAGEPEVVPVKKFESMVEGVAVTMQMVNRRKWGFTDIVNLLEGNEDKTLAAIYAKLEHEPERQAEEERLVRERQRPAYTPPAPRPAKSVETQPGADGAAAPKRKRAKLEPGVALMGTEDGEKKVANTLSPGVPQPRRLTKKEQKAAAQRLTEQAAGKGRGKAATKGPQATPNKGVAKGGKVEVEEGSSSRRTTSTHTEQENTMNPKTQKTSTSTKKAAKGGAKKVLFGDNQKITVIAKENPKREGTAAHKIFKLYKTGMTVAKALAAGVSRGDLAWDTKHGFIKVS